MSVSAFANSDQINQLIAEKQAKLEQLQKCRGTTKSLKIAGLSTLGITAVGVVANLAEAAVLKDTEEQLSDADAKFKAAKNKNLQYDCKQNYEGQYQDEVCTITRKIAGLNKDNVHSEILNIVDKTVKCNGATTSDEITWQVTCETDKYKLAITLIKTSPVVSTTATQEPENNNNEDEVVETDASTVTEPDVTDEDETPIDETAEPTFVAHALNGSCRIPDKKKKHYGAATNMESCTELDKGEWVAVVQGKKYKGVAKCSASEAKTLETRNQIDDNLDRHCWCKVSDNWVFWETVASEKACLVICADRCAVSTYGFIGDFSVKIKNALGIE